MNKNTPNYKILAVLAKRAEVSNAETLELQAGTDKGLPVSGALIQSLHRKLSNDGTWTYPEGDLWNKVSDYVASALKENKPLTIADVKQKDKTFSKTPIALTAEDRALFVEDYDKGVAEKKRMRAHSR